MEHKSFFYQFDLFTFTTKCIIFYLIFKIEWLVSYRHTCLYIKFKFKANGNTISFNDMYNVLVLILTT